MTVEAKRFNYCLATHAQIYYSAYKKRTRMFNFIFSVCSEVVFRGTAAVESCSSRDCCCGKLYFEELLLWN